MSAFAMDYQLRILGKEVKDTPKILRQWTQDSDMLSKLKHRLKKKKDIALKSQCLQRIKP